MKKLPTFFPGNSDLYDADKSIRDFLKVHKGNLNEEESNSLNDMLDRRATAISDALGVKVYSVVDHNEK